MQTIGWIGLGNMGMPMATNLLKAGHNLHIYARDLASKASITDLGAKGFDELNAFVQNTTLIFITLPDDTLVQQLFEDIKHNDLQGKTFVNCSTISPTLAQNLAQEIQKAKAVYIDAPVSGSVLPATNGTLSFLVGANSEKEFQDLMPYFDIMGKHAYYAGQPGMGSNAKLAINYYMSIVVQGFAETISYAQKLAIDPAMMADIVNHSAVGSPMTQIKTPSVLKEDYPAAFPLKFMVKDLRLAQDHQWNSPLLNTVLATYTKAMEQGEQDSDLMAVKKVIQG